MTDTVLRLLAGEGVISFCHEKYGDATPVNQLLARLEVLIGAAAGRRVEHFEPVGTLAKQTGELSNTTGTTAAAAQWQ
jgi:hypothetical protein